MINRTAHRLREIKTRRLWMIEFDVGNVSAFNSVDQLSVNRLKTLKGASSITTPEFQDSASKSARGLFSQTANPPFLGPILWTSHPQAAAASIEFVANQLKPFRLAISVDNLSYQGLGIYPSPLLWDAPQLQLISQVHLPPAILELLCFHPERCVFVICRGLLKT
jgi:hypothetical protein